MSQTPRFVQFKEVLPYQFFDLHGKTWIKAADEISSPQFNAFLLTDSLTKDSKQTFVLTIRHFDEATLVKIDPNLPRFWATIVLKHVLDEEPANDN